MSVIQGRGKRLGAARLRRHKDLAVTRRADRGVSDRRAPAPAPLSSDRSQPSGS
jgi:hypothetical protein